MRKCQAPCKPLAPCTPLAKPLQTPCKALAKPLQNPCKSLAKALHKPCKTYAKPCKHLAKPVSATKTIYGDAPIKINITPEAFLKNMKNVPKRYQNMIAIYIFFFSV